MDHVHLPIERNCFKIAHF